ncbi:MAG TPA: CvpA family protein, partial [Candidatus Paceibacterota bacterium]|nr:CvpA family protein [Candidatus Paceibacterota bacterium]
MTIWIIALLLLASGVMMGLKRGAIRASFSFAGIIFAALLAVPAGKLFKPLLPHVGIHDETLVWMIAPVVAFALVLTLFKVAGFAVHRKVNVHYKYYAGDLSLALWERMNSRIGACVGTLNGTVYLVLLCFVIYNLSYWTAQIASDDNESRSTKLVNEFGRDLDSTGMDKAARSVATMPDGYYKLADLAGLICQNPQLTDRLGRYPAFISLLQRDDLQQLAQNADLTNAWQSHAPMGEILSQPAVKTILKNNDLINTVWITIETNLDDLTAYLKTGKSAKYDPEKILGRWDFNVGVTVAMLREAEPNIPS